MLVKITTKHAIVSPVTLVTHKHFFSSVMFSKLTNQNQKTVILLVNLNHRVKFYLS